MNVGKNYEMREKMRYTVVVDNLTTRQGLYAEWGLCGCLETADGTLLFDTAGVLHVLEHNLRFLGLAPESITDIVLSHGHFDHTSGLFDMHRMAPEANIWAAADVVRERRGDADHKRLSGGGALISGLNFTAIDPYQEVLPGVIAFTVPQSARDPEFVGHKNLWCVDDHQTIVPDTFDDDVSILVRGEEGYSLLLGCAHAGLPNIMQYAASTFCVTAFDTVLGGTHLCAMPAQRYDDWMKALRRYPVKHWRPNHCTGFRAASTLARYFDDVDWAGAGTVCLL